MATVVSDTSTLISLAAIGLLDLLHQIFGEVLIPPAVAAEFNELRRREPDRFGSAPDLPAWVRVVPAAPERALIVSLDRGLHSGEIEALALALEQRADLILVDERGARRAAARWGLRTLGLLGVLLVAKERRLVAAVAPLLDRLQAETGFWIGAALRAQILREAGEA